MCKDSQLPYLHIHQDNIRTWVRRAELLHQILQCFLAVPHRTDREVKLFNCLERDLLVNMAGYLSDAEVHAIMLRWNSLVFDDQDVNLLSFALGEIHQMIRNC
jgi:hypothetical protein